MKKLLKMLIFVGIILGVAFLVYLGIKNRWINVNDFFVGNMVKGVDVSSYQKEVDFKKLSEQKITFAYIKATEGSSHVDPTFSEKWASAADSEVLVGAYHYFSYQSSGVSQAENYIKTVGDLKGRLIPAIDMELTTDEVYNPPEKDGVVRALKAFIGVVEERYGVKPIIYSRQDYWEKYLKDDFSTYPRWVTSVYYPIWVEAGDDWAIWQYNDSGVLEGYFGEKFIDLNAINPNFGLDALKIP